MHQAPTICVSPQVANDFCAPSSAALQHEVSQSRAAASRTHQHSRTYTQNSDTSYTSEDCLLREITAHRLAATLALQKAATILQPVISIDMSPRLYELGLQLCHTNLACALYFTSLTPHLTGPRVWNSHLERNLDYLCVQMAF